MGSQMLARLSSQERMVVLGEKSMGLWCQCTDDAPSRMSSSIVGVSVPDSLDTLPSTNASEAVPSSSSLNRHLGGVADASLEFLFDLLSGVRCPALEEHAYFFSATCGGPKYTLAAAVFTASLSEEPGEEGRNSSLIVSTSTPLAMVARCKAEESRRSGGKQRTRPGQG